MITAFFRGIRGSEEYGIVHVATKDEYEFVYF